MTSNLWTWFVAHPDVLRAFVETTIAWEMSR